MVLSLFRGVGVVGFISGLLVLHSPGSVYRNGGIKSAVPIHSKAARKHDPAKSFVLRMFSSLVWASRSAP
jgi:hypothetical protein